MDPRFKKIGFVIKINISIRTKIPELNQFLLTTETAETNLKEIQEKEKTILWTEFDSEIKKSIRIY